MTNLTAALLVIAVGALVSTIPFRLSRWHAQESDYWMAVHHRWLLDPKATDAEFLPLLVWKRAHQPAAWEKLRGWRPPTERRAAAQ